MSIQKPYEININAKTIDANEDNEITWKVSGGIQDRYKILIYKNNSNQLFYETSIIKSLALKHLLPNNTLENGNEYKAIIQIWDINDNSQISNPVIFSTSSRPIVNLNIPSTISSFSYVFTATYIQNENVELKSYNAILYDDKKNIISTSDIKTGQPIEHLFENLQAETNYYVEFIVTSNKGLIGTSGKVPFYVFYYRPKMNVNLQHKNVQNAGIELSWYVSQIIGGTYDPPVYIDDKIDLRDNFLYFDEGFSINGNFSLQVWLENVPNKTNLLTLIGDNGNMLLHYDYIEECFILTKISNSHQVEFHSNVVRGTNFVVLIQQIGFDNNIQALSI